MADGRGSFDKDRQVFNLTNARTETQLNVLRLLREYLEEIEKQRREERKENIRGQVKDIRMQVTVAEGRFARSRIKDVQIPMFCLFTRHGLFPAKKLGLPKKVVVEIGIKASRLLPPPFPSAQELIALVEKEVSPRPSSEELSRLGPEALSPERDSFVIEFDEIIFSNEDNAHFLEQAIEGAIASGELVEFLSIKRMILIPALDRWIFLTPIGVMLSLANRKYVSEKKNKRLWKILIDAYKSLGEEGYALFHKHFDEHSQYRWHEICEAGYLSSCVRKIVALLDQPTIDKDSVELKALTKKIKTLYQPYLFYGGFFGEYDQIVICNFMRICDEVNRSKQHWASEKREFFYDAMGGLAVEYVKYFDCGHRHLIATKLAEKERLLDESMQLQDAVLALRKTAFSEEPTVFATGLREECSIEEFEDRTTCISM
jgi:hypothetical protein